MSMMDDSVPGWESRPCNGVDLVLWYGPPEADDGGYLEPPDQRLWRERRAKAICESCPFRPPCLEAELTLKPQDQWGVRAGLTASQRRGLIRRRKEAAKRAAQEAA